MRSLAGGGILAVRGTLPHAGLAAIFGSLIVVVACASPAESPIPSETSSRPPPTEVASPTPEYPPVSRQALMTCLADAGLAPRDTNVTYRQFYLSSSRPDVGAFEVQLPNMGMTLVFVFDSRGDYPTSAPAVKPFVFFTGMRDVVFVSEFFPHSIDMPSGFDRIDDPDFDLITDCIDRS